MSSIEKLVHEMGDAKDAGVLILLVPGVLSPLFVIFKILVFRLLGWKLNRPLLWRIFFTALAESSLPMITLLISFPILLVTRLASADLQEQQWFRISSLLILLQAANCSVNHIILSGFVSDHRLAEGRQPSSRTQSLFLGVASTLLFIAAWFSLGSLLLRLG